MPNQKRDYPALKLEFFESDIDEVKPFFEQRYNQSTANNKQIAKHTKGRAKEKQERKRRLVEKALSMKQDKEAKELAIPISYLLKAKKNTLIRIAEKLSDRDDKLSITEMTKGLEAMKTELGEPSKITQNMNLNKETNEELTEEEKQALELIITKMGKVKK